MTQTMKGMQDFLPARSRKKNYIEEVCREVFTDYGYRPLETPALEYMETLTKKGSAGEAIVNEIYAFSDKAERYVGLRFDLTVSLARVVAADSTLVMPFRRYAIGRVYRYDKPSEKRYREFTQADIDTIGSDSLICELECLDAAVRICKKLNIDFEIAINSRKLLEALAEATGIPKDKVNDCFRILDKIDKIGKEKVTAELKEKGLNVDILSWISETDLGKVRSFLEEKKASVSGIDELEELMTLVKRVGMEKLVKIDLSLARGLAYYTGVVIEVKTKNGPSIAGGGRYDKLISNLGGRDLKACGISFGIDRILDTIEETLVVPLETKVMIIPFKKDFALNALDMMKGLRDIGVSCEMDVMQRDLRKNLDYANKQGVPYVIVLGEKEIQAQEFKLKDMKSGKETLFKFGELDKCKELIDK